MTRKFLILGGINAFLAVALGAFAAHTLEKHLDESMLDVFQTGTQYQMYHALGLIAIALIGDRIGSPKLINRAGWLLTVGIILFSFSLYALALSGVKPLGAITPFGGVSFLAGWTCVIVAAWKSGGRS